MPTIERHESRGRVPLAGAPRVPVDGGAFGQLAELGLKLSGAAVAELEADARAAQAVRLVRREAAIAGAGERAKLALADDTDYESQPERFARAMAAERDGFLAGIADPDEQELAAAQWDARLQTGFFEVARSARKGLVDQATAALDRDLADYARRAAATGDDAERQRHLGAGQRAIETLAAGRVIDAVAAEKRLQRFRGKVDEADARELITADPLAAVEALADPEVFPQLEPVQRQRLYDSAVNRELAETRRRIAEAERAERQAERAARDAQELATGDLLVAVERGAADMGNVTEALAARRISPTQFGVLKNALDNRDRAPGNDAGTETALWEAVYDRDPKARQKVLEAQAGRRITGEKVGQMLGKIEALAQGAETDDERAAREDIAYLEVVVGGQSGPAAVLAGDAAIRTAEATRLFRSRLAAGTPRAEALAEAVDTWAERMETALRAPPPRFLVGAKKEPNELATRQAIADALQAGGITEAEALAELRKLENLLAALAADAAAQERRGGPARARRRE